MPLPTSLNTAYRMQTKKLTKKASKLSTSFLNNSLGKWWCKENEFLSRVGQHGSKPYYNGIVCLEVEIFRQFPVSLEPSVWYVWQGNLHNFVVMLHTACLFKEIKVFLSHKLGFFPWEEKQPTQQAAPMYNEYKSALAAFTTALWWLEICIVLIAWAWGKTGAGSKCKCCPQENFSVCGRVWKKSNVQANTWNVRFGVAAFSLLLFVLGSKSISVGLLWSPLQWEQKRPAESQQSYNALRRSKPVGKLIHSKGCEWGQKENKH